MAEDEEEDEKGVTSMSSAALTRMVRMDGKLDALIEAHENQLAWWSKALTLIMNPSRNFLILVGLVAVGGGAMSVGEVAAAFGYGECECEEEPQD